MGDKQTIEKAAGIKKPDSANCLVLLSKIGGGGRIRTCDLQDFR
jgi:hypothetical protein